jgi:hypothetical protein
MKKICLLLMCLSLGKSYSQSISFGTDGIAEVEIKIPNKTSAEIFTDIDRLLSEYNCFDFGKYTYYAVDSTFTVPGRFYNAFGRDSYPSRKPNIAALYNMKVKVKNSGIIITFYHKSFIVGNYEHFINFSKFISGNEDVLVYPGEKECYVLQFEGMVKSIKEYLNNGSIRRYSGSYFIQTYVKPLLFNFSNDSISSLLIELPGTPADELYLRLKSFLDKANTAEFNDQNKEVFIPKVNLYDVFNWASYIEPEKTIINATYQLKFQVSEGKIMVIYTHLLFLDESYKEIDFNFSQIADAGKGLNNLTSEDREYFIIKASRVVNALKYYLDTKEIRD